jgi:hypothetical protein
MSNYTFQNVQINIYIDREGKGWQNLGKFRQRPSMLGFSYSMIEQSLVEMHNVAPDDVPALRSRFGALQRGGLLGRQPGKGVRVQYGPDELHRVVLAFELTQAGFAPSLVLQFLHDFWDKRMREICLKAESASVHGTPDVLLIMAGVSAMEGPEKAIPNVNYTTAEKPSKLLLAIDGKSELPARALVVNLSAQLRRFHTALTHYHLRPEMLAELEAKPKSKRAAKPRRRTTRSS